MMNEPGATAISRAPQELVNSDFMILEAGCAFLSRISTLGDLELNDTRATEEALRHLASLSGLRRLALHDSKANYHLRVTGNAVAELMQTNPNLVVDWNGTQNFTGYSRRGVTAP
jgi:hypothetical protein